MALLNYSVAFIDSNFYRNDYGTKFSTEWDALSQEEQNRFINLASTRIKRITDRPFIDLNDLEIEQGEGVQIAVSRLIDYWMEYGLDLNRISGSITLGSYSASQTVPSDPDYIPENIYEVLQDVNMYTPVGYFREDDLYRADDQASITYGVRFKTLERVKDITLDKTDAEAANKSLSIPTSEKVYEEIRVAKLSPFVIIGDITGEQGITTFPSAADIQELFVNGALDLDSGVTVVADYTDPTNPSPTEHKVEEGEAIRIKLFDGNQEVTDYDGTRWNIDENKNAQNAAVKANTDAIALLNGTDADERAIKQTEGDSRYIKTDGTNEMKLGYTPTTAESVTPKSYVDSADISLRTDVDANAVDIANTKATADDAKAQVNLLTPRVTATETVSNDASAKASANETAIVDLKVTDDSLSGRVGALEQAEDLDDKVWSGSIPLTGSDDLSAIVDQNGDAYDFTSGKRLVVYIKHTADNQGKSTEITVDDTAGGSITIPTGNQSDTIKIDLMNNGMFTASVTNGNTPVTAYELYRLVEGKAVKQSTGASYSKTESDAKYASKVALEALDIRVVANKGATDALEPRISANEVKVATNITNISANTTNIDGKQDKNIPASTTTDKTVSGAINEIDSRAKNNEADINEITNDGKITSDDGTTRSLTLPAGTGELLLSGEDMEVTFKDGTTATYKLGK